MQQVENKILSALLDSYENSKLSRHENVNRINISYDFRKKNLPQYFDESSLAADDINEQMMQLQQQGLIRIQWKNNRAGNIIDKVILCESEVAQVYKRLKRIPMKDIENHALEILAELKSRVLSEDTRRFILYIRDRIERGKSVKEYVDITAPEQVRLMLYAVDEILNNEKESYIREFSIEHFHDSKMFEAMIPRLCRIIKWMNPEFREYENEEILEEFNIFNNPGYVYIKGSARLVNGAGGDIDISCFRDGIGFALEKNRREDIRIIADPQILEVYTIENLTSFYRFTKENSLVVYLGGYHNSSRRQLLKSIYEQLPVARYYHFGDIDVGGFQIYYHLRDKTGIPFSTYNMDLKTLKKYEKYAKELTDNDSRRLINLMESRFSEEEQEVARYMLAQKIKLEQECIR